MCVGGGVWDLLDRREKREIETWSNIPGYVALLIDRFATQMNSERKKRD
jgi:hypothetical protein